MARKGTKHWKTVWTIFIILIMVGSTAGLLLSYGGTVLDGAAFRINGKSIRQRENLAGFEMAQGKAIILFTYDPVSVNRTRIDAQAISQVQTVPYLYFTSSPNLSAPQEVAQAQFELGSILRDHFNVQSQIAFTEPFGALPVVTCANASPYLPVIEFRESNETSAEYAANCLVLSANSPAGFAELRDRVVYGLFGVLG